MSRSEQYRDALELWAKWWDGPGREFYRHWVLPPLTITQAVLECSICQGVKADGERCSVCGRDLS